MALSEFNEFKNSIYNLQRKALYFLDAFSDAVSNITIDTDFLTSGLYTLRLNFKHFEASSIFF